MALDGPPCQFRCGCGGFKYVDELLSENIKYGRTSEMRTLQRSFSPTQLGSKKNDQLQSQAMPVMC